MKNLFWLLLLMSPFIALAQEEGTLLGSWSDPTLVGSTTYDNTYNEIWGYTSAGKEYAIIGSTEGTHFIDVTNPSNPTEIAFVEGGYTGPQVIHRDYHDYNGYLYVVCDEDAFTYDKSTLQIIDLSGLPNSVEVVYDSNDLMRTAHNIFIDESTARLYACAASSTNGYHPLKVYDISNPVSPTLLANHNSFDGGAIGQIHDIFVKDNFAYLNAGYDGLFIVDFTNVNSPVTLASLSDYSQDGYNHSGWPTEDGNYYYFSDEDHGLDVKAVDVSDLSDVSITSFFDAGPQASSTSIPHNQIVRGNYLYISYYYDGLQVYDLTDPANPERVMFFDTSSEPNGESFKGAWGIYPFLPSGNILVSDMQTGLSVIEAFDQSISSTTNINQNMSLNVFPQPAKDQLVLQIKIDRNEIQSQLQLFDLMGNPVYTKQINLSSGQNDLTIDEINSLSAGYYILKVQGTDWELTERVVIVR